MFGGWVANPSTGILAAWNFGNIQNVFTTGKVSGYYGSIGGIVGFNDNENANLRNSWSNSEVRQDAQDTEKTVIGVGTIKYATLPCIELGGLVGRAQFGTNKIEDNFSIGNVRGLSDCHIGGIVGLNYNLTGSKSYIRRNYFAGEVSGAYQNDQNSPNFGLDSSNPLVDISRTKVYSIGGIMGLWYHEGTYDDYYGSNRRNMLLTYENVSTNKVLTLESINKFLTWRNGNNTADYGYHDISQNNTTGQNYNIIYGLRICEMVKYNGLLSKIINKDDTNNDGDNYDNNTIKNNFSFSGSNDRLPYVCKLAGSTNTYCNQDTPISNITGGQWQVDAIAKWVKNADNKYGGPTTCTQ